MLDLIEIELTRVRRMAEQADDKFLLYLIDIAIMEANRRAKFSKDDVSEFMHKRPAQNVPQPDQ
jgi:hypothetical protein